MAKPYLVYFYSIATLVLSRSIFCSNIPFCDESPFGELCKSNFDPEFESHESQINASISQAKIAWMDCLELYLDVVHHLNFSMNDMNTTEIINWINSTLVKHQDCQKGFKDCNLSLQLKILVFVLQKFFKSNVDLPAENKSLTSSLSTSDHRVVRLGVGAAMTQVDLVVATDGSGDFYSVTEAVEASKYRIPGRNRFVIHVKSGVYVETVIIQSSMANLTLIGDGIDATIITHNKNINDGLSTSDTATFQIWAPGFVAVGITFENLAGPKKQQAVALLSASDHSAFYKCSFIGYQDTLYLFQNRQFFRECDIYGTVDFIFGDAAAVFQNCNIYVRKPLLGQQNTITAQGRSNSSSPTGFVIHNSKVTMAREVAREGGLGSVQTFLGRPWREFSRVVFVKCYIDSVIDPEGWLPYNGSSGFDTVFYAEYMNSGIGADISGRVKWPGFHVLTSVKEADQFSVGSFLAGDSWIPQTGVPYYSGGPAVTRQRLSEISLWFLFLNLFTVSFLIIVI